jgi:hypothetical protein
MGLMPTLVDLPRMISHQSSHHAEMRSPDIAGREHPWQIGAGRVP